MRNINNIKVIYMDAVGNVTKKRERELLFPLNYSDPIFISIDFAINISIIDFSFKILYIIIAESIYKYIMLKVFSLKNQQKKDQNTSTSTTTTSSTSNASSSSSSTSSRSSAAQLRITKGS